MAKDLMATLRLRADGKGFVGEIRKASKEVGKLGTAERQVDGATRGTNKTMAQQTRLTRQTAAGFGDAHKKVLAYSAGLLSIGAALRGINGVTQATIRQQDALAQVEARVRSTGGAAGLTTAELAEMAAGFQKVTTFGDEEILELQSTLLSFRGIGREAFAGATEATLNLAVAMRTDLRSAVLQIGKALDDPKRGLDGLSRSGTQFTDAQKEQIKALVDAGKKVEAQALVLKELETQYGNSARAARDTFGGALKALGNAFGDLQEVSSESTGAFTNQINALTEVLANVDTEELHHDLAAVGKVGLYVGAALAGKASLGLVAWSYNAITATTATGSLAFAQLTVAQRTTAVAIAMTYGTGVARAYAFAMRAATLATPVGLALLAASAIYQFATASDEAAERQRDLATDQGRAADRLATLREKWDELTTAERRHEANQARTRASALGRQVTEAEAKLSDLEEAFKSQQEFAAGPSGSFGNALKSAAAEAARTFDAEVTEAQAVIDGLRRRQKESQRVAAALDAANRTGEAPTLPTDADNTGPGTSPPSAAAKKLGEELFRSAAQRALQTEQGIEMDYARQLKLIKELEGDQTAALEELLKQKNERLAKLKDQQGRDANASAAEVSRIAAGLLTPAKKLEAAYKEQVAAITAHTKATGENKDELLGLVEAQYDAGLAAINGTAALEQLKATNAELAGQASLSRAAIERRNRAAERELELAQAYPDASATKLDSLREEYELHDRLIEQQSIRAELLERYAGDSEALALREQAVAGLLAQGQLTDGQARGEFAEINIAGGEGSFADGFIAELERMREATKNTTADIGASFHGVFGPDGQLASGIANASAQSLVFGESFRDAFGNVARQAVAGLLAQMIQVGIQWVLLNTVFKATKAKGAGGRLTALGAEASATTFQAAQNAYAATAAIPVVGPALAPAAATKAAVAAAKLGAAAVLAYAPAVAASAFATGGIVEGAESFGYRRELPTRNLGIRGEAGPEAILPLRRLGGGELGVVASVPGPPPGSRSNVINLAPHVEITIAGNASAEDAGEIGDVVAERIADIAQSVLIEHQRPGGLLNS